jgi:hypothetical protein
MAYAAMMAEIGGPGYEEEWWEEEGEEWEYASYHKGGNAEHATGHTEEALLVQPLGGEDEEVESKDSTTSGRGVRVCKVGSKGLCARDVQGCFGPSHGCGRPGQHRVPYHNPEPSAGPGRRRGGRGGGGNSPGQRAAMRCVIGAGLGADGGPLGAAAGCVIGALWEY